MIDLLQPIDLQGYPLDYENLYKIIPCYRRKVTARIDN